MNFAFKGNQGGTSTQPCSETYPGHNAFSELEVEAFASFYSTIAGNITGFIDLHSYRLPALMYPFSVNTAGRISNEDEHVVIGEAMVRALEERYGTKFAFGDAVKVDRVASGSSSDWVKGVMDTPFAWIYELRGTGTHSFLLPAEEIIPAAEETFDSFITFVEEARKFGYFKIKDASILSSK